ncbi:MAG: hypothetical protein O3A51_07575, partial [Verrucomicrobia bacterium]|nr:hypothetical protein [Verrucomicrobiota bacterium]
MRALGYAVPGIQDADSALFRRMLPGKTVITVGHAVDIVEHPARTQQLVQVLFVGTAGAPNRLALAEFLKNVWP